MSRYTPRRGDGTLPAPARFPRVGLILVVLAAGASGFRRLDAQPPRRAWLPNVSASLRLSRSTFQPPYRGEYRTDLAPMVSVTGNQDLGSGFAVGVGVQYLNQRLTGLGPVLRYRLEYLEVPVLLARSLGWIGPVSTEIHGGGLVGLPLRCRVVSAVPGGDESTRGCGDPPVAVEKHRLEASLRLGAAARVRLRGNWVGLTGGLQYGLRDVFGRARVTTLLLGAELGR